jgi:hypothetical protein
MLGKAEELKTIFVSVATCHDHVIIEVNRVAADLRAED